MLAMEDGEKYQLGISVTQLPDIHLNTYLFKARKDNQVS